jgi:hypothetical protein
MNNIDYSNSKYPVRSDFAEAHNRYWAQLASAGTWLTGEQRVAVAKEVRESRSCELCARRKTALSPYQVDGDHDKASDLSDVMVEVVHRIISDPVRLTKTWFEGIIEQGLKVEEYVEILGTLVHVLSIDEFCRGIDIPLNALPQPVQGEPSYEVPAGANMDDGAWVPMLPDGPQPDIWGDEAAGANVLRAFSLVPDEVRSLLVQFVVHYLEPSTIMDLQTSPKGTLSRIQTEVVATRVSGLNGCFY